MIIIVEGRTWSRRNIGTRDRCSGQWHASCPSDASGKNFVLECALGLGPWDNERPGLPPPGFQCNICFTQRLSSSKATISNVICKFPIFGQIFACPHFETMVFQLLINPLMPCMTYCMPWLVPIDVSWRTHITSEQFPAMHVKFSNIICKNFVVPSCKTNHLCNHSIKRFQASCRWNHFLSQRIHLWWNARAAPCNRSISSCRLPAFSVDNIQPSHLWDDEWSNPAISKPARVVNVFGGCAWVVKTFVFAALSWSPTFPSEVTSLSSI